MSQTKYAKRCSKLQLQYNQQILWDGWPIQFEELKLKQRNPF